MACQSAYIHDTEDVVVLRFQNKKTCLFCGKVFKETRTRKLCCSRACSSLYKFGTLPYQKDDFVNAIIEISQNIKGTPQKRDCKHSLYHAAVKFFGTWNKAMEICGLKPNHSKYQKLRLRCTDGHMADSLSEKIIDEWFLKNGIKHDKNKKYPFGKMNCDFYLEDYNIWVEYFGLAGGDIEEYDETIITKHKIAKDFSLNLISLYPVDLYGDKNKTYDEKLRILFEKCIGKPVGIQNPCAE